MPFTRLNALVAALAAGGVIWIVHFKFQSAKSKNQTNAECREANDKLGNGSSACLALIFFEELLFLAALGFWSWVRSHNPDIRGLEKFMDYGFVLSILRGRYFPPLDHFLSGYTINYYYFGHLLAAVLARLSGVRPAVAFNLQIANLFALTVLESFVMGSTLYYLKDRALGNESSVLKNFLGPGSKERPAFRRVPAFRWLIFCGLLSAVFVAIVGNFHLVIEYLKGQGESYWYASASRVIPYTINEFPVYSFIVADLHGHVSDLPIVLLFIGILISLVLPRKRVEVKAQNSKFKAQICGVKQRALRFVLPFFSLRFAFCAFLLGTLYATNSWDFAIYGGLLALTLFFLRYREDHDFVKSLGGILFPVCLIVFLSVLFFLPFWLTVKPISQGIGLVALQNCGKIQGGFVFFRCWLKNLSPLNLILILWGFYFILAAIYLVWLFRGRIRRFLCLETIIVGLAKFFGVEVELKRKKSQLLNYPAAQLSVLDIIPLLFIFYALILIIAPEIVFVKDIYQPDYYRANTMFKLYYQAWVLFALATAYGTTWVLQWALKQGKAFTKLFLTAGYLLLTASVLAYPYVGIKMAYVNSRKYRGLDGNHFLEEVFPGDARAIKWINKNILGQPVIVEAVGESYTDYARICGNTGLPAVLGWPVHEWLWRGGWDAPLGRETDPSKPSMYPAKRQAEVKKIYEAEDVETVRGLLKKYQAEYIYVGQMEREKYPNLQEDKFSKLGKVVYENEGVRLWHVGLQE